MITVAIRKYAQALGEVAAEVGREKEVFEELRSFAGLMEELADLRGSLVTPAYPLKVKQGIIEKVCELLKVSPLTRNFLLLLVERNRIGRLSEVLEAYQWFLDDRAGILRVEASVAQPLEPAGEEELRVALQRILQGEIRLQLKVDEALIGGVVIQVGSTVFDGSIRAALNQIRKKLIAS